MSTKKLHGRPAESQIPALARQATGKAYKDAVSSGRSVLVAKGDTVCQVSKDGTSRVIKETAPSTSVKVGSKRTMK